MIDYVLWICVITLVQLSLIYLWFDSAILSPLFQWCLKQNKDRWYTWFIFTLLTCPQCLGYWFAWACAALGLLVPGCPIVGVVGYKIWMVFFSGLAVAVLSRLIDGVMPEPVNKKLFIVDLDDEDGSQELNSVLDGDDNE